jgi:hypothetical protein
LAGHVFTPNDASVVTVNANDEFEPGATGTTTVRVERLATAGLSTLRAIVRVSVHSQIERIWSGNNHVTVRKDESNFILSVYAKFTDGAIADISGHPYLRYFANPSFVLMEADGRVNGRGVTDGTPVSIEVQGLADTPDPVSVEVAVSDPAEELIPTLVPIWGSEKLTKRRNLLLVTEGASGSEMTKFRTEVANEICRRVFRSKSHSPFYLLRDSFNFWLAMQPSPERGITVGPMIEIKRSAAEPFEPDATTTTLPAALFPLQAKDSYFGLMYGARLGDPDARIWRGPPATDLINWLQPAQLVRAITIDYRRLPDPTTDPVVSFRVQLDAFFDRLGPDAAHWKTNEPDAGLVCFLVNDDFHGGRLLPDQTTVAASLGHGDFFLDSLDNPPLHPGRLFWDHEPRVTSQRPNIEHLTAKVSHELGHSPVFNLGDEYENARSTPGEPATSQKIDEIESYRNLHISHLVGTVGDPPAINTAAIKWNLTRLTKVNVLSSTPVAQVGGDIVVPVEPRGEGVWTIGDIVFLRVSITNPARFTPSPPLELTGFDRITHEVRVRPTGGLSPADYHLTRFIAGSLIYLPRSTGGVNRLIIHPEVLADLGTNGAFLQLSEAQCRGTAAAPADNPREASDATKHPRIVPGDVSFWVPDYKIIGLYEGGGNFRCRVYRPSGQCRMRNSYDDVEQRHVDFCFVCQFTIVESINAGRHPSLDDKEYPE